jgi:hypothetical protein
MLVYCVPGIAVYNLYFDTASRHRAMERDEELTSACTAVLDLVDVPACLRICATRYGRGFFSLKLDI